MKSSSSLICFSFVALLASACGVDKKLPISSVPVVDQRSAPLETQLPVAGGWKAALIKEDPGANKPSVNAEITFYANEVHQKTTCSLRGYWVSATVIVPVNLDDKQVTVLAGNTFSNKLDLGNGASYDCTATLPTGVYPYEINGSTLTIRPAVGSILTFTR